MDGPDDGVDLVAQPFIGSAVSSWALILIMPGC